jgi:hypothetical protein
MPYDTQTILHAFVADEFASWRPVSAASWRWSHQDQHRDIATALGYSGGVMIMYRYVDNLGNALFR